MKAPDKILPTKDADYLEVMTRAVFQSGFNWSVIANKWPGFCAAFDDFDPQKVASYDEQKIAALMQDSRIVRNGVKIKATVHNARTLLSKAGQFGSFKAYLDSFADFESAALDLRTSFKWLGDFGAFYVLYVVDQPVPDYEEWCKSRGITPMQED